MRTLLSSLLPLLACSCVLRQEAPRTRTSVVLLFGERAFDEDLFAPLDEHGSVGLEVAAYDIESGHGFAMGVLMSEEEDTIGPVEVDMAVGELWAGYRHTWGGDDARWRPFLGVGPVLLVGEINGSIAGLGSVEVTESTLGAYAQAGVRFPIGDVAQVGASLRTVFGTDIEEQGIEADLDYTALLFSVGVGF